MNKKIKSLLSIILTCIIILSSLSSAFFVFAASNNKFIAPIGDPDPSAKRITTAEELRNISSDIYGNYVLANDIDLSSYESWDPICKMPGSPFKGNFDGQGHKITGLKISISIDSASLNNPAHAVGLFGICDYATIKNLAIENASISVSNSSGYEYTNVAINGRNVYAGTIAGYIKNTSTVYNCYSSGTVIAESSGEATGAYAGGLVGYADVSVLSNSFNMCSVSSSTKNQMIDAPSAAGGVVAIATNNCIIDRTFNTGKVTASSLDFGNATAGGIVGNATGITSIKDSFNEASVTATAGNLFSANAYAGGISGNYSGTIYYTYNSGTVSSSTTSMVSEGNAYSGGICGVSTAESAISNSVSISNAVSASAAASKYIYRISNGGTKTNNLTNSYMATGSTNDADSAYAVSAFESAEPFSSLGWDFGNTWIFTSGKLYPQLKIRTTQDEKYISDFIEQHVNFIQSGPYNDVLNNQRWAKVYWSEEYCGKDNGWYNFFDALGNIAQFKFGELFKSENLFSIILADYISSQGIPEKVVELSEVSFPLDLDVKYGKAKSFLQKYWDKDAFGELSDEDIFYLFHYEDRPSEEWVNSNFPMGLESIVYDTKHEGEWLTDILGIADESITSIQKAKDKVNGGIEFINNCITTAAAIDTFMSTSKEFRTVLDTVANNIDSELVAELCKQFGYQITFDSVIKLKDAINNYTDFLSTSEGGMRVELWASFAVEGIIDNAFEKLKDSFLTKTTTWLTEKLGSKAVAVLKSIGWAAEGTAKLIDCLTNESELQEYRALLQTNAVFENAVFHALKDIENQFMSTQDFEGAMLFDTAFVFLKQTEIYSMDILVQYMDKYQTSIWTTINNASGSSKASEIEEVLINKKYLYNTLCHGTTYSLGGKIITVACPTDVVLYDENNVEVVKIINNEVIHKDDSLDVHVTNSIKYILVPLDHEYSINITSTDQGLMEYSVAEYNEEFKNVQTSIYTNIELEEGNEFSGKICGELLAPEDAYDLTTNGEIISADFIANEDNPIILSSSLSLECSSIKIVKGDSKQLSYSIDPVGSSIDTVLWSSTNTDVVTVDEYGNILAVNPGTATVSAAAFCGGVNDSVVITVIDADEFAILTNELPDGYVNLDYKDQQLSSTNPNATWSIIDGALPDGLSLSQSGIISGCPTKEGIYSFTLQANDNTGNVAQESLVISIPGTATAPVINTTSLPDGHINQKYEATITANSFPVVEFTVCDGELPQGLVLDKKGQITGIPTQTGIFTFKISARNGVEPDCISELSINVKHAELASGKTGDLTWTLIENGELIISGAGAPADYSSNKAPWYSLADQITSVVFNGNITKIGSYMFEDLKSVKEIIIPETVKTIEENSFRGCSNLESITIPFIGASKDASNTYDAVFGYIFGRMTTGEVGGIVQYYTSVDNSLKGYTYAIPDSLKKVIITNAENIPFGAFYNCNNLENIVINEGVKHISQYAYRNCNSLTNFEIPKTVTSIDEGVLQDCNSIEYLTIPFTGSSKTANNTYDAVLGYIFGRTSQDNGIAQYCTVDGTSISYYYYAIPSNLKEVLITNASQVPVGAFCNCSNITNITLNDGIENINQYAFYNCIGLTNLVIPNSVNSIEEGLLEGCNSLESITLPFVGSSRDSTNTYDSVLGHIFGRTSEDNGIAQYCTLNGTNISYYYYAIPSSLKNITITDATQIPFGAFCNCSNIQTIALNDGISKIDGYSFYNCSTLNEINLNESVSAINSNAFNGCSSLNKIVIFNRDCTIYNSSTTISSTATIYGYANSTANKYADTFSRKFTPLDDAHEHSYTAIESVKPDCTNDGYTVYKCDCGETYTKTLNKLGHSYSTEWTVDKAATCSEEGSKSHHCIRCDDKTDVNVIEKIAHSYVEVVTESTCTEDGYTTYTCEVCGNSYKDNYISKLDHDFVWVTDKEATCGETGVKHEECTRCDVVRSENTVIEATGDHNYVSTVTAPTCTTEGYTTYVCEKCGNSYTDNVTEKIPHAWTWIIDKDATCGATGIKHEECSVCHAIQNENTVIEATGKHDYVSVVTEPTCTEKGCTTHTCKVCNYSYTDNYTNMIEHKWTWVTDKEPTCNASGIKHEECSVCNEKRNINTVIDSTGEHTYVAVVTEPTCTSKGYTTYTCSGCGTSYIDDETDMIPHNWKWIVDVEATCGENGIKHQECAKCNAKQAENTVIEATGKHTWKWVEDKSATCGAIGYKHQECTVCGVTQNYDTEIPATGLHIYNKIITAPTCTKDGYTTFTCSVCNHSYISDKIAKTEHIWTWVIDKDATCGEIGVKHEECVNCDAIQSEDTVIPATGKHTYGETTIVTAPTCKSTGKKVSVCTICGYELEEVIEKVNHTDTDGDGICDNCGIEIEIIDPSTNCSHLCHSKSGFVQFFYKIFRFFWKLFGINKYCSCGVAHY